MRFSVLLFVCLASTSMGQKVTTPKMGSPERKAILDAVRPLAERKIGHKVKFEVTHLKVSGGFAFMMGRPVRTDGKRIDWTKTIYAEAYKAGAFDDGVMALLQKGSKGWKVLEWALGATDYPCEDWVRKHKAPGIILNVAG